MDTFGQDAAFSVLAHEVDHHLVVILARAVVEPDPAQYVKALIS